MKRARLTGGVLLLFLCFATAVHAASTPVEMLRDMFRTPTTEWREHLRQNQQLLTEEFFNNVEMRVRWGIENNHIDDAFRFAMVGDFAAEIRRRPASLRIDLAELFFKAENYIMAGQVVDNIIISSPGTPAAQKAQFLRGRLLEMQKDLFAAHQAYRELAESRYEPETTWFKAAQISLLIQQEGRAEEEFRNAAQAGSREAKEYLARMEAMANQGFNPIAPIPNSPESGLLNTEQSQPSVLSSARLAAADGRLEEAAAQFQMALASEADRLVVYREYAAVLYRDGNLSEALRISNDALRQFSEDVELLRIRGNIQERLFDRAGSGENLKRAIEDYRKGLGMDPNHEFLNWELRRAQAKS